MRDITRLRWALAAATVSAAFAAAPVLRAGLPAALIFPLCLLPYAVTYGVIREPLRDYAVDWTLGMGRTVFWTIVALMITPTGFYLIPIGVLLIATHPKYGFPAVAALALTHWVLIVIARDMRAARAQTERSGAGFLPLGYLIALLLGTYIVAEHRNQASLALYASRQQAERTDRRADDLRKLRNARHVFSVQVPSSQAIRPAFPIISGASALIPVADGVVVAAYQTLGRVRPDGYFDWWHALPMAAPTKPRVTGESVIVMGIDSVEYRVVRGKLVGAQAPDTLLSADMQRAEATYPLPPDTCHIDERTISVYDGVLTSRGAAGDSVASKLSGPIQGMRCSTHYIYVLNWTRLMVFDAQLRMAWEVDMASFKYPLEPAGEITAGSLSLRAVDDQQAVVFYQGLLVVRPEGLVTVVDDQDVAREVALSDNVLYRLTSYSDRQWLLDAFALPPVSSKTARR